MDREKDKRRKARAQRAARAGERKLEAKIAQLEKDLGLEKVWREEAIQRANDREAKLNDLTSRLAVAQAKRAAEKPSRPLSDAELWTISAVAVLECTPVTDQRKAVMKRLYEELRYRGILPEV